MPEKIEESFDFYEETHQNVLEQSNKANSNKCKKILKLFRSVRKEKGKIPIIESGWEKNGKKDKKKKCKNSEERKEMLKKNIENNWMELSTTLKRKMENLSEEILPIPEESECNGDENNHSGDDDSVNENLEENGFEKECEFKIENLKQEENEPNALPATKTNDFEICAARFDEKNIQICEELQKVRCNNISSEEGEMETEELLNIFKFKKKKFGTDKVDDGGGDGENSNKFLYNAAVKEMNLIFHNLARKCSQDRFVFNKFDLIPNDNVGESDLNKSLHVSAADKKIIAQNCGVHEETVENELTTSKTIEFSGEFSNGNTTIVPSTSQTDCAVFSGSESGSARSPSFQCERETNSSEYYVEMKYVCDNDSESCKNLCQESLDGFVNDVENSEKSLDATTERKNKLEFLSKQNIQYSDIIFPVPSRTHEFLINKDFKENVITTATEDEKKFSYEEIRRQKFDLSKSENENKDEELEGNASQSINESKTLEWDEKKKEKCFPNENAEQTACELSNKLTDEQRAKKKSAEAIAKELTSHVFSKKHRKTESLENSYVKQTFTQKNNFVDPSENHSDGNKSVESLKLHEEEGLRVECKGVTMPNDEKIQNNTTEATPEYSKPADAVIESKEEKIGENTREQESESENVRCLGLADWWKMVNFDSEMTSESITNDRDPEVCSKLTVPEILKRFEELGNKHFADATDDERTITLREINRTLKCLEEKVKNFSNWNGSPMKVRRSLNKVKHKNFVKSILLLRFFFHKNGGGGEEKDVFRGK